MTAADLADMLATLGDTPDAVADQLRALGIKGGQSDYCGCPIARYLLQSGAYTCVFVAPSEILADADMIQTPMPIALFIGRFDVGDYPDLAQVEVEA